MLVKKSRLNGGINFEQSVDSRRTLLNLRFNEHDCYHRASCFKKGCECRAKLPMLLWPVTSIEFDTMNKTPWYSINGSRTIRSAFQVNTKRLHGDQF